MSLSKEFDGTQSYAEIVTDAFSKQHLNYIKRAIQSGEISPSDNREDKKTIDLKSVIPVTCHDAKSDAVYQLERYIGLELHLPLSARIHFHNNHHAHAAVDFLFSASFICKQYTNNPRYEHEKQIIMNWKDYADNVIARKYATTREQIGENMSIAYQAVTYVDPNILPIAPQIMSFETAHNVTRKPSLLMGFH